MKIPAKFVDNPRTKMVHVYYEDGAAAVLEAVSFDKYTPPPGYGDKTIRSPQQFRVKYGDAARKRSEQFKNCAYFHSLSAFN